MSEAETADDLAAPERAFTVLPGDAQSPVILHVPHSGTLIPAWVRDRIVLDDEGLTAELWHMTDAGTAELSAAAYEAASPQPWVFGNDLSRLVIDPERFPDEREEMREVGMGAVYTCTSQRERLRATDPDHENDLLAAYFHPYASALAGLVDERLAAVGAAVIVDLHSYPVDRLPYELHPSRRRPPVCLGVNDTHTPDWLLELAAGELATVGESVVDEPFAGTYVPLRHYQRDRRVHSIMLEIRRDVLATSADVAVAAAALARVIRSIGDVSRATPRGTYRA